MSIWASQVALVVKNLPANAVDTGDVGLIPGSSRFPRRGNDNPLQYSCLENPMERGAWQTIVYRVAKSRWRLKRHGMHAYTPTPFQLCGSGAGCQFSQHHAFSCHSWLADRWISDPNKINKSSSLGVFGVEKIIQPVMLRCCHWPDALSCGDDPSMRGENETIRQKKSRD